VVNVANAHWEHKLTLIKLVVLKSFAMVIKFLEVEHVLIAETIPYQMMTTLDVSDQLVEMTNKF
jgi:hypothetical protein